MTDYKVPYEGGCRCGEIRYRCNAEPVSSYHCYCRDCQRGSGTGFASRIAVETPAFEILSGKAQCYSTGPDDGTRVQRYFCGTCGTDVYAINVQVDVVFATVGGLDDPSVFKPTVGFWVSSAQPWVKVDESIQNFDTQPTIEEIAAMEGRYE